MLDSITADTRLRTLLSAAAPVISVAGLRAVSELLDPLLTAGVVVACAAPLQEQLRCRGLPFWATAVTSLMVTLMLLTYRRGPIGALFAIPLTTAVRRAVMPSGESADDSAKTVMSA